MRDGYQRKMKEIFIARGESHSYSNGRHFGFHAPTRVCHFDNRASCVSYPDGQTNYPTFQRMVHRDRTVVQLSTRVMAHQCVSNTLSTQCIDTVRFGKLDHPILSAKPQKLKHPVSKTRTSGFLDSTY
jgi:hypothetical protein